jgi:DNA-binding transcriptional MerR regulator
VGRQDQWTLLELAEQAGIPARTVRFYIARGLLPGPAGGGRGALYGAGHLERLQRIRRLQEKGQSLAEIALALDGARPAALPPPSAWWQYPIAADVLVWVRADASPWRLKQVRKALEQITAQLASQEKEETDG